MPIAAVPNYLGSRFSEASPGMRFGMYLQLWEGAGWSKSKDRPLNGAKQLNDNDKKTLKQLAERQAALAATLPGDHLLHLGAKAIAPFTTGLGNEHPLENGFAFLNPYGLPYLPGSGVKGVLRQSARELASGDWGKTQGWSEAKTIPLMRGEGAQRKPVVDELTKAPVMLSQSDVLFGLESKDGDSHHVRGALTFWDVIPWFKADSLSVEIMTPHQGHYYQQSRDLKTGDSTSPHDSGQPNPISFLTVPPGAGFTFHVVCDLPFLNRIAPALAENRQWQTLLIAAFEHAFQWLGFGAKTAVGYGAMASEAQLRVHEQQEEERKKEEASTNAEAWPKARVKINSKNGSLSVEKDGKSATASKAEAEALLNTLPPDLKKKVLAKDFVKVTAYVKDHKLVRVEAE